MFRNDRILRPIRKLWPREDIG